MSKKGRKWEAGWEEKKKGNWAGRKKVKQRHCF